MKLHTIAMGSLRRRKARTIFLAIGLMIAVATVSTLITVSQSMNANIAAQLDEFGANILIVPKSDELSLNYGGMAVSGVSFGERELKATDAEMIRTIKNSENISIIAPKLLHAATIEDRNVLIVGVDFREELRIKKWWSIVGKRPESGADAIIGKEAKLKLGLGLNKQFSINGTTFTVGGILEETGSQDDGLIFIDLRKAQEIFGKPNAVTLIEVAALCYNCPIEEIVRQTSEKLPTARVTAIRQTIASKMEAMHNFERFSVGISLVVLVIGAIIMFTNMTASVNERTREIGLFRALGFRQYHIMKIILLEALVMSFVAGILGYGVGLGVSRFVIPLMTMSKGITVSVSYVLAGFSVVLAIAVGVASSMYPALRASRLEPTVALRAL